MTEPDIEGDLPPMEFVHHKGQQDALVVLAMVFVVAVLGFLFGMVALL